MAIKQIRIPLYKMEEFLDAQEVLAFVAEEGFPVRVEVTHLVPDVDFYFYDDPETYEVVLVWEEYE